MWGWLGLWRFRVWLRVTGFELRSWELGDLPLVREASRDDYIPLITTVPAAYSEEAGEALVRRQWERASSGSGYPFVIVRVADGRPVGMVGLWLRERARGARRWGIGWLGGSWSGGCCGSASSGRCVGAWRATDPASSVVCRAVECRVTADG